MGWAAASQRGDGVGRGWCQVWRLLPGTAEGLRDAWRQAGSCRLLHHKAVVVLAGEEWGEGRVQSERAATGGRQRNGRVWGMRDLQPSRWVTAGTEGGPRGEEVACIPPTPPPP